jgi:hypothetical protein
MPAPVPAKPVDRRPADAPDAPAEETFWQTYSPNLELPISTVASIFAHVLLVAVLFLIYQYFSQGKETASLPIVLVDGGSDATGDGSPGSGGTVDPVAVGAAAPKPQDFDALPLPNPLPDVRKDIQDRIAIDDPNAVAKMSDEKAAAYGSLDKALQDKLLGLGQKKGNGTGPGTGDSGQPGTGGGGTGADSTRARGLRWVVRFKTTSGRDYVDQLAGLGAVIAVPAPPDYKKSMLVFRNPANPAAKSVATDQDFRAFGGQIQFCDFKRESVQQVSEALNLTFTPPAFWAFFPKELEEELSRKETAYRNKRSEEIEETKFQVLSRGGKYEAVVVEQTLKR